MSGKNEDEIIEALKVVEYELNKDYFRQFPVGERYVLDFAFPEELVAIEVDGENHRRKDIRKIDAKRDRYLALHNWVTLRITEREWMVRPSFYKSLIKQIVEERREQLKTGRLSPIEFSDFKIEDIEDHE